MKIETVGGEVTCPLSQRRVDCLVTTYRVAVRNVLQVVRGTGLAILVGSGALAVALIVGLTDRVSIAVFPIAAIAAAVYALIPDSDVWPQRIGSMTPGLTALAWGLGTGFGVLEISMMIGAVAATLTLGQTWVWRGFRVVPTALAGLALLSTVLVLLPLVLDGGGLGHDESAYALKARHWLEGTPETGWSVHRGIAMSGYGYLILSAGGDEAALRVLGLVSIVGFAVATWALGSRIGGRWVGPLAAIALVSSPVLLRRSTEYLSDVPSSALLMACMVVAWREFGERERPTYRLLWLLPFAWTAFYLRYQSALTFALIAATVAILFWDEVKAGWRPIATTVAVGVVGLIPHFIFAVSETGSPLGILLFTADVAGREFYGQGLIDYFLLMGWPLAAFAGPVAALFFVWWLIREWRSPAGRVRPLFLMVPAVAQVVILGVLSHGEARFIFFPLALTLIGGVAGALAVTSRWQPTTAAAVRMGLAVLLVGSLATATSYVRRAVEGRADSTELIVAASREVDALSGEESCGVMTSYFPQVSYYSSCYTQFFRPYLTPEETLGRLDGENRFLLIVEDGKNQPDEEREAALVALTGGKPIVVSEDDGSAEIYRFDS